MVYSGEKFATFYTINTPFQCKKNSFKFIEENNSPGCKQAAQCMEADFEECLVVNDQNLEGDGDLNPERKFEYRSFNQKLLWHYQY